MSMREVETSRAIHNVTLVLDEDDAEGPIVECERVFLGPGGSLRFRHFVGALGVLSVLAITADAIGEREREISPREPTAEEESVGSPPLTVAGRDEDRPEEVPDGSMRDASVQSIPETHQFGPISPTASLFAAEVIRRTPRWIGADPTTGAPVQHVATVGKGARYSSAQWVNGAVVGNRFNAADVDPHKSASTEPIDVRDVFPSAHATFTSPAAEGEEAPGASIGQFFAADDAKEALESADVVIAALANGELVVLDDEGGADIISTGLGQINAIRRSVDGPMMTIASDDGIGLFMLDGAHALGRVLPSDEALAMPIDVQTSSTGLPEGVVYPANAGKHVVFLRLDVGSWPVLACSVGGADWIATMWGQLSPTDAGHQASCPSADRTAS